MERVHIIEVPPIPPPGTHNYRSEARLFLRVLRAALKQRVLLLYSSRGEFKPELLAAVLISFIPRRFRPLIVFYGDMYEPSPPPRYWVERLIMHLADRAIGRYIVLTSDDVLAFASAWKLDPGKIKVCPAFGTWANREISAAPEPQDYIFAGGESFRHFEPLLAAAAQMPHQRFLFCSSMLTNRTDIPKNVTVTVARFDEYLSLMRAARVVVVPLRQDIQRSAGAATYLNAMWLKKPVVVTDAMGVRDFVEDKRTGLVADGSPESYVEAIHWMLAPENAEALERMKEEAHRVVDTQFTLENHVTQLLDLVDEAITEMRAGRIAEDADATSSRSTK